MQFDLVNIIGVGVLALAAFLLHRRYRGGDPGEVEDIADGQRRDVLRAIKSMRKDE